MNAKYTARTVHEEHTLRVILFFLMYVDVQCGWGEAVHSVPSSYAYSVLEKYKICT